LEILGSGAVFEIVADHGIVRCAIVNRDDVDPEEGARCAAEINRILSEVLGAKSAYKGVIFDVRQGPAVFGPKTRASLEQLFQHGERAGRRSAVRLGSAAIQKLQFTSLCRENAPSMARVFENDDDDGWAKGN
jgi:hypothetical protein